MKRKVLLSVLLLMVLFLAVPAVNAISANGAQSVNLGTINDLHQEFVFSNPAMIRAVFIDSVSGCTADYEVDPPRIVVDLSGGGYASVAWSGFNPQVQYSGSLSITYNYEEPIPEPTGPYITASVYNTGANNAYYDYNVQCLPGEGYFFAPLSFYSYGGQLPQCDLTSAQTLIQVRVYAGEDIPIYSCALSGSGGVPNFQYIQTVLAAPVASSDVITGETVREELESIPNPVKASSVIVSGSWQALAIKKNVSSINTPFSEIISNSYHYFTFPNMTSPDIIKASLLNGTGNITLPLYNAVDGFTSLALLLPNYVSGVLTGLINPIAETVETVKDVILTTSDYVQDAMQALYAILPFIYLFIPDFVWWGFTIYLSYLVFAWILTLLCGYDVISTYYVDPFVSWVKSRRGGE